jgi:hypothetical protein
LLCQKAIREHPEIDDRAEVLLEQSFVSAHGHDSVHAGRARWAEHNSTQQKLVRCLMRDDTVVKGGPVTSEEFSRIVYDGERI